AATRPGWAGSGRRWTSPTPWSCSCAATTCARVPHSTPTRSPRRWPPGFNRTTINADRRERPRREESTMAIEELIRRYEAGGGHLAKENAEGLAVPPALRTVVLTCMDSRLDVFALLGRHRERSEEHTT